MIISKIYSGLGNQMFQYAAGQATALRLNTDLKLDLSWFDLPVEMVRQKRNFELGHFSGISIDLASPEECRDIGYVDDFGFSLYGKIHRRLQHFYRRLLPKPSYVSDQNNSVDLLLADENYYLDGYWQSETYFENFTNQIVATFAFPEFENKRNIELANELLKQPESVAIHIRRGDYVSSTQDLKILGGICTTEYYKQATSIMAQQLKKPIFVVFSDEPQWASENLNLPQTTIFVDWNSGRNSFCDMQLMTCSKHNIIANSSFSWWGAWLNRNPRKIVIAPAKWTNDNSINAQYCVPSTWLKL